MSRIFAQFDRGDSDTDLGALCLELLNEQRGSWPELAQAYQALDEVKIRSLACNGFLVRLVHNPGRMKSTSAAVTKADIDNRPCFLCEPHLADRQKAILYQNDYLILSNPMPVTHSHFTIAHRSHQPQAIAEVMDSFLRLSADFGTGWIILYNGPRCGASAPDHLHFQAIPAGFTPIENEMLEAQRLETYGGFQNGITGRRITNLGREVVLLAGREQTKLTSGLAQQVNVLRYLLRSHEEPMMNLMAHFDGEVYRILLFPRRKHRPDVYFKKDDSRIVVSPAVMEMAGIVVTPFLKDFERLDGSTIEAIYREVTLDLDQKQN